MKRITSINVIALNNVFPFLNCNISSNQNIIRIAFPYSSTTYNSNWNKHSHLIPATTHIGTLCGYFTSTSTTAPVPHVNLFIQNRETTCLQAITLSLCWKTSFILARTSSFHLVREADVPLRSSPLFHTSFFDRLVPI